MRLVEEARLISSIELEIMKALTSFAVGAVLLLAGSASAATISNPIFSNGDITIDAQGNSTVSGTFTLQVGQNEVCEVLRTQADPSQPFTDAQVGGPLGYQWGTHTNVPFSVKVPPNTATYYPTTQCAGLWGGNHSVDGADNVVANANLGTLRVTAAGSGSVGGTSLIEQLQAEVKSLLAQVSCMGDSTKMWSGGSCVAKPAPTKPAYCAQMANHVVWQGQSGGAVSAYQMFLISNGFGIPAGPTGYFGNQTAAAASAMAASCSK